MAAGHSNGLSSVPEHIPGVLIEQPEHRHMLRTHLAQMTDQHTLRWVHTSHFLAYLLGPSAEAFLHTCATFRFPGSQPVSFDYRTLDLLMQEEYVHINECMSRRENQYLTSSFCSFWVCEKSDGVRVLVMIVCPPAGQQEVYLVSSTTWKLQ